MCSAEKCSIIWYDIVKYNAIQQCRYYNVRNIKCEKLNTEKRLNKNRGQQDKSWHEIDFWVFKADYNDDSVLEDSIFEILIAKYYR